MRFFKIMEAWILTIIFAILCCAAWIFAVPLRLISVPLAGLDLWLDALYKELEVEEEE